MPRANKDAKSAKQHRERHGERNARHCVHPTPLPNENTVDDGIEGIEAHRDKRGPRILNQ